MFLLFFFFTSNPVKICSLLNLVVSLWNVTCQKWYWWHSHLFQSIFIYYIRNISFFEMAIKYVIQCYTFLQFLILWWQIFTFLLLWNISSKDKIILLSTVTLGAFFVSHDLQVNLFIISITNKLVIYSGINHFFPSLFSLLL